jgi:hypothetical protein
MKKSACALGLVLLASTAWAIGGPSLWFEVSGTPSESDVWNDVAVAGKVIVAAGGSTANSGNVDYSVVGFDAKTGARLWNEAHDESGGEDGATAVATRGKTAVTVGYVTTADADLDAHIRAYDAKSGRVLFSDTYDHAGFEDAALGVAILGKLAFVAIRSTVEGGDFRVVVRAYDLKSGSAIWTRSIDAAGVFAEPRGIAATANRVIVTGVLENGGGDLNFFVQAWDAKKGTIAFSEQIGLMDEEGTGNAIATRGKLAHVAGSFRTGGGDLDVLIRTYDVKSGRVLWSRVYGAEDIDEEATDIVVKGKRVYAVGWDNAASGFNDFAIRAVDGKTGEPLWSDRFGAEAAIDRALGAAVLGRLVAVVGRTGPDSNLANQDAHIRVYDGKLGTLAWSDSFPSPTGLDEFLAVALRGKQLFAAGSVTDEAGDSDALIRTHALK